MVEFFRMMIKPVERLNLDLLKHLAAQPGLHHVFQRVRVSEETDFVFGMTGRDLVDCVGDDHRLAASCVPRDPMTLVITADYCIGYLDLVLAEL